MFTETVNLSIEYQSLRIYKDENLKWNVHIDTIVYKISVTISIFRCLKKLVPVDTLTPMYNAIVLPHFFCMFSKMIRLL